MSPRFAGLRGPQAGSSTSYTNASPADRHGFRLSQSSKVTYLERFTFLLGGSDGEQLFGQ